MPRTVTKNIDCIQINTYQDRILLEYSIYITLNGGCMNNLNKTKKLETLGHSLVHMRQKVTSKRELLLQDSPLPCCYGYACIPEFLANCKNPSQKHLLLPTLRYRATASICIAIRFFHKLQIHLKKCIVKQTILKVFLPYAIME